MMSGDAVSRCPGYIMRLRWTQEEGWYFARTLLKMLVPTDLLMAPIIPIINFKIISLYISQGSMEIIRDDLLVQKVRH